MNQEQLNSLMVSTRMDTTQGHTFSVARTIGVTTWQSVSDICHCVAWLGDFCVEVTGTISSSYSNAWGLVHVKTDGESALICPCHLHMTCSVCSTSEKHSHNLSWFSIPVWSMCICWVVFWGL